MRRKIAGVNLPNSFWTNKKAAANTLGSPRCGCYCTKNELIAPFSTSDRPPPNFPPPPAVLGSGPAPLAFPSTHKKTCTKNQAGFVSSAHSRTVIAKYLSNTKSCHHLRERARFGNSGLVYLLEEIHLCFRLSPHLLTHLRGVRTTIQQTPYNSQSQTSGSCKLLGNRGKDPSRHHFQTTK